MSFSFTDQETRLMKNFTSENVTLITANIPSKSTRFTFSYLLKQTDHLLLFFCSINFVLAISTKVCFIQYTG